MANTLEVECCSKTQPQYVFSRVGLANSPRETLKNLVIRPRLCLLSEIVKVIRAFTSLSDRQRVRGRQFGVRWLGTLCPNRSDADKDHCVSILYVEF